MEIVGAQQRLPCVVQGKGAGLRIRDLGSVPCHGSTADTLGTSLEALPVPGPQSHPPFSEDIGLDVSMHLPFLWKIATGNKSRCYGVFIMSRVLWG